MVEYIHKVNGTDDKTSLHIVIPKDILKFLEIKKGDFVEINRIENKIIINKLVMKKNSLNCEVLSDSNQQEK